jgi:hypothetical protein
MIKVRWYQAPLSTIFDMWYQSSEQLTPAELFQWNVVWSVERILGWPLEQVTLTFNVTMKSTGIDQPEGTSDYLVAMPEDSRVTQ